MERQRPSPFDRAMERGTTLVELNRHGEAMAHFRDASREDPESFLPWCWLSYCARHQGDAERALEYAREGGRRAPEEEWPHRLEASARLLEGNLERAYEAALRAARLDPELPVALYLLGFCAFERGRTAEAQELGERVLRLDPEGSHGPLLLARIAERRDRARDARGLYEHALRNDPRNAEAMEGLARLHERREEYGKSLDLLQMALREDPGDADTQQRLQKVLFEVAMRGSRGRRWRSLGAGVALIVGVYLGLVMVLAVLEPSAGWWARWKTELQLCALPVVLLLYHALAIPRIRDALPNTARLVFESNLAASRRRSLRLGLGVVGLYLGAAGLHAVNAGAGVLVSWIGIPLAILAMGFWLYGIALAVCFVLILCLDALSLSVEWLAGLAPDAISGGDVVGGVGLVLAAASLTGEWWMAPNVSMSVAAALGVVVGLGMAIGGFRSRSLLATAIGCVVLGLPAATLPFWNPELPPGLWTLGFCGGLCVLGGGLAVPGVLGQRWSERRERLRMDRLLGTPPEPHAAEGAAESTARSAGILKLGLGVGGSVLVAVTLADIETHSTRAFLGLAAPGALALAGALEVATGRSFRSLSRSWTGLSTGRRLAILGLVAVVWVALIGSVAALA